MNQERVLARRLMFACYGTDEALCAKAKDKEMNYTELGLLYALHGSEPMSQKELSDSLFFPPTTVNTIVKAWEKKGLLVQVPVEGKRREKHIVLTEEGERFAQEHMEFIYQVEEQAMKKTLERYSAEFIDALEYYGACLHELFEEEQEPSP